MFPLSFRLLPASLRSIRITGLLRSYGRLRLPVTPRVVLAFYACSTRDRQLLTTVCLGLPGCCMNSLLDSTRSKIPRVAGRARLTRVLLLPADSVKPSAFPVGI